MSRPSVPAEAFPDGRFDLWPQFVLDRDADVIHAAATAVKVSAAIESRRAATGETMRALAAALGITRSVLTNTARCLAYPQATTISRLQESLSVPIDPTVDILLVKVAAQRDRQSSSDEEISLLRADNEKTKEALRQSEQMVEKLRSRLACSSS